MRHFRHLISSNSVSLESFASCLDSTHPFQALQFIFHDICLWLMLQLGNTNINIKRQISDFHLFVHGYFYRINVHVCTSVHNNVKSFCFGPENHLLDLYLIVFSCSTSRIVLSLKSLVLSSQRLPSSLFKATLISASAPQISELRQELGRQPRPW